MATTQRAPWYQRMAPNLFGICFGVAGLAEAWATAAKLTGAGKEISLAIYWLAAVLWVGLCLIYLAKAITAPRRVKADLQDSVLSPLLSMAPITGLILGKGLFEINEEAGRIMVGISAVALLAMGGLLIGDWIVNSVDQTKIHPGYLLPTVAGGLVAGCALSVVGHQGAAYMAFGAGIVSWIVLISITTTRLFFTPMLPQPLIPTLAIELAPPVVAGMAWVELHPGPPDIVQYGFAGYALLMVTVQLRFLPLYLKLRFNAGFWAFTFSYASAVTYAITWLAIERPTGYAAMAWILIAAITILVAGIFIRSIIAIPRKELLTPV